MKKRQFKRPVIAFPVSLITSAIVLAMASQPILAQSMSHTVQPGEYLYSIAQQYGVTVNQLKEWNHLTSEDVQTGTQLIVTSSEVEFAETAEVEPELIETDLVTEPTEAKLVEAELVETDLVIEAAAEPEAETLSEPELLVEAEDSEPILTVAAQEEVITEATEIDASIPAPEAEPVTPAIAEISQVTASEEDYSTGTVVVHVVKAGEYLNLIARNYGVTANELRLWNHLTSDTLQIGQALKVIPDTPAPTDPVTDPDDQSGDLVSYVVKAGDTLWGIATRFGVSTNDLRLWNHLTSDMLQIGQNLKLIPDITDPAYPSDPDDHSGDVVTYLVKAGDTLWSIANRFDVSLNNLRLWNHLTTDFLSIGQELKLIPPTPAPIPSDPDGATGEVTTYSVKAGDTLWAISRRFNVTVNQIKQWNNLRSNFLSIGQRLSIGTPTTTPPPIPTPPPSTDTRYTVRSGDSLWSIATRHSVTVAHLKQWNGLTSNLLTIGQKLIVAGEVTPAPPTTTRYTVRSGDTLWAISRRNGVTVNQLMTWNKLTSSFLSIGQQLNLNVPRVTYKVQSGDSLWKIATQFGSTVEQLKNWNALTTNVIYTNQVLIVK